MAIPPSPPPPPSARRTVAWFPCTRLVWAAVDAVICLFLASMWLLFWGLATMEVGRLACGEGCAVVTAAYKVIFVAGVTLPLVFPLSALVAMWMVSALKKKKAAVATDIEATEEPVPRTSGAAMRDALRDPVISGLLAFTAFALLMIIGVLLKGDSPVMGSRRERMGSVIYDVGALGMDAMDCLLFCPIMTVRIWRFWRMARHAL